MRSGSWLANVTHRLKSRLGREPVGQESATPDAGDALLDETQPLTARSASATQSAVPAHSSLHSSFSLPEAAGGSGSSPPLLREVAVVVPAVSPTPAGQLRQQQQQQRDAALPGGWYLVPRAAVRARFKCVARMGLT